MTNTLDLFSDSLRSVPLDNGAVLLGGFALPVATALLQAINDVVRAAPLRHMVTPGGLPMSVAMSNCGSAGWVSDRRGYRYAAIDPDSGLQWPEMPQVFSDLATSAAQAAGFPRFVADACLVNRYQPGTRLTLHQDKNEHDFTQPIVSVSLGLPAVFLWGGQKRAGRAQRIPLEHGDVVVWGGPSRLNFHGVQPLADGIHALTGRVRYNLTFRCAL
jgi:alkylated DNA repair protein (DNA oxidative demethylase)